MIKILGHDGKVYHERKDGRFTTDQGEVFEGEVVREFPPPPPPPPQIPSYGQGSKSKKFSDPSLFLLGWILMIPIVLYIIFRGAPLLASFVKSFPETFMGILVTVLMVIGLQLVRNNHD